MAGWLVVLEAGKLAGVHDLGRLPATVGTGPGQSVTLSGRGRDGPVAEVRPGSKGVPELRLVAGESFHRLRPGKRVDSGDLTFLCIEAPASGASPVAPLLRLLEELTTDPDPGRWLERVLDALREALGARFAALVSRSEDSRAETLCHAGSRPPGVGTGVSRTVLDRLVRGRTPLLTAEVGADPRLAAAASIPSEVCSVIAAELDGEAALYLESAGSLSGFDEAQAELLRRLSAMVASELRRRREASELRAATERLGELHRRARAGSRLVGSSSAMAEVREAIAKIATSGVTTLVLGETGTGKELVARAIHEASSRRDGPLVAVNCAALPGTLVESELFGHARGAFTGAGSDRLGRFELAHGGTLFLDEVAELPPPAQAKLLRVLQERTVVRVGETRERPVDVVVVAATHRDPEARIASGELRSDLYYRLAVFTLRLPALRERRSDLRELALHLLEAASTRHGCAVEGFTQEAEAALAAHSWPGNVRELANVIEAAVVRRGRGRIEPADFSFLPAPRAGAPGSHAPPDEPLDHAGARHAWERGFLERAMRSEAGDLKAILTRLGLSRSTFYEKCQAHGLDPADYRR